ncbi:glycosyl transferase [Pedobacter sp. KBS0701]|uniref:glycosyl transferase n=1 Tax=Pedobacter sp. KBS0701 TaxID=2578106 RepID=UPI00110EF40F|nr:glycosyl transferase [Pedobacter sp. KBS0701]QDW25516.1 glycosyl transferase [Pedobacter sp. KBS0701]
MKKKISTFVINLEKRPDRKRHILNEFLDKPEFDLKVVNAIEHTNGSYGLWMTISHILCELVDQEDEFFLIVEDDHVFTEYYDRQFFLDSLAYAGSLDAEVLLGGVSWFNSAVPASRNLFWIDTFNATQFVIVYKSFYSKFIKNLETYSDSADINISKIADRKFVLHPFISTQKEFGYSDATAFNVQEGYVTQIFTHSKKRLKSLNKVLDFYSETIKQS